MDEPLKDFSDVYINNSEIVAADKQLAESIKKDLLGKLPEIKERFNDCSAWSFENMVNSYARYRFDFTRNAKYIAETVEKIPAGYRTDAEKFLEIIQFKKLFDLQCRWRAGKIKLQGINTTFDFQRWTHDVYHCPFLPPVTQAEVDLMIRFLNETPADWVQGETFHLNYDWHNYPYLKICYCEHEEIELQEFYKTYNLVIFDDRGIPPWYEFYDTNSGTGGLLALPDIKFPKEQYYIQLYNKQKKKEKTEKDIKEGVKPPVQHKPDEGLFNIGIDVNTRDIIDQLVEEFETAENKKRWEIYKRVAIPPSKEDEFLKEEVRNIFFKMNEIRERIPLDFLESCGEDWRESLIITYRKYEFKNIIAAIPFAYDDYLKRIKTGTGFPVPDDKYYSNQSEEYNMEVLQGRKLAGEPMDFDY